MEAPPPSVSVIIPVYNSERFLKECLDSVLKQSLSNIEIIIINDGSTDNSEEICKTYLFDPRVQYYCKQNEGTSAARQDGLERATGDYVGFVDSDDWLEPNMYEIMYNTAIKENADIVMCGFFKDNYPRERESIVSGVYDRYRIEYEILPRTLAFIGESGENAVINWSNCFRLFKRKTILDNNISFDRSIRRSEDLQFTFEVTLVSNVIASICDEHLYHVRMSDNNASKSRSYTKDFWLKYRLLIEHLYMTVDLYKRQDLSQQMNLCVFFLAESVIKNEYTAAMLTRSEKKKKLDAVLQDEYVKNALSKLPKEKFNRHYTIVYNSLMLNSGDKMYRYLRKNKMYINSQVTVKNRIVKKIKKMKRIAKKIIYS